MNIFITLLAQFRRSKSKFCRLIITVDEISAPKKQRLLFSAGKVVATVFFWNSHWVLLIDYHQKGRIITAAFCASWLDKLKTEIAKNHTSAITIDHPPYSSELAPSDLFSFPNLKNALGRQKFSPNEETNIKYYFAEKDGERKLFRIFVRSKNFQTTLV